MYFSEFEELAVIFEMLAKKIDVELFGMVTILIKIYFHITSNLWELHKMELFSNNRVTNKPTDTNRAFFLFLCSSCIHS